MSAETPNWLERLVARLPRRAVPPYLLAGYTQRVMERLQPRPSAAWWTRPAVRWSLAPALATACVLCWVGVATHSTPERAVLAQAIVLDRLNEPWNVDAIDEETLVDDAHQVDRFVLAEAHAAAVSRSAEALIDLLDHLGEAPLEALPEGAPDDGLLDAADLEFA